MSGTGLSGDHYHMLRPLRKTSRTTRWLLLLPVVLGACLAVGELTGWSANGVAVVVAVGLGYLAVPPMVVALFEWQQHLNPSISTRERDGKGQGNGPELKRFGNPRYDFWFSYPAGWARRDPQNNDGYTYVCPENPAVEVSFSGGNRILGFGRHADPANYLGTIVESQQAGGHVRREDDNGYTMTPIPGWRVIEVQASPDGLGAQHIYQWFDALDREIAFHGQAPVAEYPYYRSFFLRLIDSIAINSHSDPNPNWTVLPKWRDS